MQNKTISKLTGGTLRGRAFILGLYVVCATISYLDRNSAIVILLLFTLAVNVFNPNFGLMIAVFVAPLQNLFGLHDTDFTILRYGAIGITAFAFLIRYADRTIFREPLFLIVLAFGVLLFMHMLNATRGEMLREFGWYFGILGMFTAAFYARNDALIETVTAVYATVLLSGVVSALDLFGNLDWLIESTVTLYENVRLSGVQYNPNVLSKISAIAVVTSSLLFFKRPYLHLILLPVFSAILYATGSKAGIGSALMIVLFAVLYQMRYALPSRRRTATAFGLSLATMVATHFILQPLHGSDQLIPELRVGQGYAMSQITMPDGTSKTEYIEVRGIEQTGQRLRLWSAGLSILKEHWLWGLGPVGLTAELTNALSYPFSSPHSGPLELLVSYGILGGALYCGLLLTLMHAVRRLPRYMQGSPPNSLILGPLAVLLLVELVEPSISFGYGVVGTWFWCYAGLLASFSRQTRLTASMCPTQWLERPTSSNKSKSGWWSSSGRSFIST